MKRCIQVLAFLIIIWCIACGGSKPHVPMLTVDQKLAIREAELKVLLVKPFWDSAVANLEAIKKKSAPDGWAINEDADGALVLVPVGPGQKPLRQNGK